jgi:hypothetical protein
MVAIEEEEPGDENFHSDQQEESISTNIGDREVKWLWNY